ncbi:MAG: hypothetical protein HY873_04285 [Chloroflexi bacterium]|nr:hypothetical protein [Chloroflexota bacterium]
MASLALAGMLAGGAVLAYWFSRDDEGPSAVIVDQIGTVAGSEDVVARAGDILELAGYDVEYVTPEEVTVDFYRHLPEKGYDLIVLRTHIASFGTSSEAANNQSFRGVALFTNEPYSTTKYVEHQRDGRLSVAANSVAPSDRFFSLDARFIAREMEGRFDKSLVMMMGCDGLATPVLADAFVRRGAGSVVSWDATVTSSFSDEGMLRLLGYAAGDLDGLRTAVIRTAMEVGPDPMFGATLAMYP